MLFAMKCCIVNANLFSYNRESARIELSLSRSYNMSSGVRVYYTRSVFRAGW